MGTSTPRMQEPCAELSDKISPSFLRVHANIEHDDVPPHGRDDTRDTAACNEVERTHIQGPLRDVERSRLRVRVRRVVDVDHRALGGAARRDREVVWVGRAPPARTGRQWAARPGTTSASGKRLSETRSRPRPLRARDRARSRPPGGRRGGGGARRSETVRSRSCYRCRCIVALWSIVQKTVTAPGPPVASSTHPRGLRRRRRASGARAQGSGAQRGYGSGRTYCTRRDTRAAVGRAVRTARTVREA